MGLNRNASKTCTHRRWHLVQSGEPFTDRAKAHNENRDKFGKPIDGSFPLSRI